jgi:hypothetical protein
MMNPADKKERKGMKIGRSDFKTSATQKRSQKFKTKKGMKKGRSDFKTSATQKRIQKNRNNKQLTNTCSSTNVHHTVFVSFHHIEFGHELQPTADDLQRVVVVLYRASVDGGRSVPCLQNLEQNVDMS